MIAIDDRDHTAETIFKRIAGNIRKDDTAYEAFITMISAMIEERYVLDTPLEEICDGFIDDLELISRGRSSEVSVIGSKISPNIYNVELGSMLNNAYTVYRTSLEEDGSHYETFSEMIDATLDALVSVKKQLEAGRTEGDE